MCIWIYYNVYIFLRWLTLRGFPSCPYYKQCNRNILLHTFLCAWARVHSGYWSRSATAVSQGMFIVHHTKYRKAASKVVPSISMPACSVKSFHFPTARRYVLFRLSNFFPTQWKSISLFSFAFPTVLLRQRIFILSLVSPGHILHFLRTVFLLVPFINRSLLEDLDYKAGLGAGAVFPSLSSSLWRCPCLLSPRQHEDVQQPTSRYDIARLREHRSELTVLALNVLISSTLPLFLPSSPTILLTSFAVHLFIKNL